MWAPYKIVSYPICFDNIERYSSNFPQTWIFRIILFFSTKVKYFILNYNIFLTFAESTRKWFWLSSSLWRNLKHILCIKSISNFWALVWWTRFARRFMHFRRGLKSIVRIKSQNCKNYSKYRFALIFDLSLFSNTELVILESRVNSWLVASIPRYLGLFSFKG